MKTKLLFLIFYCGLAASFCNAQTIDTAQVEVIYYCEYIGNRLQPEDKYNEYLSLRIGERYTHFSSETRRLRDSLKQVNAADYRSQLATSEGKIITPRAGETEAELRARGATMIVPSRKAFPGGRSNFLYDHYFIDRRSGEVLYGGKLLNLQNWENMRWEEMAYKEIYKKPIWTIDSDTASLANYICQKATTNYGGRNWTVWFTPEIPIGEGPWVLRGLRGLILKAESADKEFVFTASSLNRVLNAPIRKDEIKDYRFYSKKDVLRMKKEGLRNPYREIEYNGLEIIND